MMMMIVVMVEANAARLGHRLAEGLDVVELEQGAHVGEYLLVEGARLVVDVGDKVGVFAERAERVADRAALDIRLVGNERRCCCCFVVARRRRRLLELQLPGGDELHDVRLQLLAMLLHTAHEELDALGVHERATHERVVGHAEERDDAADQRLLVLLAEAQVGGQTLAESERVAERQMRQLLVDAERTAGGQLGRHARIVVGERLDGATEGGARLLVEHLGGHERHEAARQLLGHLVVHVDEQRHVVADGGHLDHAVSRALVEVQRGVEVGAQVHQILDDVELTAECGDEQRRGPEVVHRRHLEQVVHARRGLGEVDDARHRGGEALVAGLVQRRPAVLVVVEHIRVECLNCLLIYLCVLLVARRSLTSTTNALGMMRMGQKNKSCTQLFEDVSLCVCVCVCVCVCALLPIA